LVRKSRLFGLFVLIWTASLVLYVFPGALFVLDAPSGSGMDYQVLGGSHGSMRPDLPDLIVDGTTITLGGYKEYDLVEVKNSGVIRVDNSIGWLNISARTIAIDSTSEIDGDGRGSIGGEGCFVESTYGQSPPCCGSAGAGTGGGAGGCGGTGGCGGGHGGAGGGASNSYGAENLSTIDVGSGGGGGGAYAHYIAFYSVNARGGNGGYSGAAIRLRGREINVFGTISANGYAGGSGSVWSNNPYPMGSAGGGGGGSGGGILIEAEYINASGATLEAKGSDGGDSWQDNGGGGGGGGGGRIKIFWGISYNNNSILCDVSGGLGGQGAGDGQNGASGFPGTIYQEKTGAVHDIAVFNMHPASTEVISGKKLNVTVSVKNEGFENETFLVEAFYDVHKIGNFTVVDLPPVYAEHVTFSWDTIGVPPGDYTLSSQIDVVSGENETDDNSFVDGAVSIESLAIIEGFLCDSSGNPKDNTPKEALAYFKIGLNNTATEPTDVLVTLNVYDNLSNVIGLASFQGPVLSGESSFILGIPIPQWSHYGAATAYANAFTDWPFEGGVPYCQEIATDFEVLGS